MTASLGPIRRFLFADDAEYQVPLRAEVDLPLARQEALEERLLSGTLAEQLAARAELWANLIGDKR